VFFDSSTPGTSVYGTGVKGKMSFDFVKDSGTGNTYTLNLGITNTSPPSGRTSGTLVGFAFNEPLRRNSYREAISLTRYNPLTSGFGRVFGGTTGVVANPSANLDTSLNITSLPTAPYAPFSDFDFCARKSSSAGCHGNSASDGIAGGTTVNVQFRLLSNLSSISTADLVAERFYNLFNSFDPSQSLNKAQIALRFQGVTNTNGQSVTTGEKVTGAAIWRSTGQAPTDQVPGPLPILGGAAAFGWSRKIRRLIRRSEAQTHSIS
jgi:hypothetical protein